jgi:hypothetical protein
MRIRHQHTAGFVNCAPGSIEDAALDIARDLDEFDAEDWMRWTFKGGGGVGGIIATVAIAAVLGAVTGGIGFALAQSFSSLAFLSSAATIGGALMGGAVTGAIGGALTGALGMMMGGSAKPDEGAAAAYQARDNKITVRNSVAPRKKIYGSALAGGVMLYAASTGSAHEYMHMVIPVASHPVQSIREALFNNLAASNSRFDGFYRLNKHTGSQTQVADADLVSEAGGEWTNAHRLRETAYIYPRIKYDTNAWVSGMPSTSVMVDGGLLYDPRSAHAAISSSAAGSLGTFSTTAAHGFAAGDIVFIRDHIGATYAAPNGLNKAISKRYTVNTVPSASSLTLLNDSGEPMALLTGGAGGMVAKCGWSNNAPLAILDYITSRDGINCKTSEVDWPYWEAAAIVADEDVDLGTSEAFTVSATANALTLAAGTGWQTGKQVFVSSSGTLPAPLVAGTAYYWIRSDETTGQLATSYDNALASNAIDLTDTGSGTHTVSLSTEVTLSASADTVTLPNLSTFIETGDCVNLSDAPQTVTRLAYTTTAPGPIDPDTGFPGPDIVTTHPAVTMTMVTSAPSTDQFAYSSGIYTFNSSDRSAGKQVQIGSGAAQSIPVGLTITVTNPYAGQDFYWINTDYLTGKLATSRANAMAGVTVDLTIDGPARITRKNQARYTINGIIDLSKKPIDILNEMLTACGGVMVYTQGKYRLFPAAPASSVKPISERDLRGSIKILPHTSRMTLVNAVRGTYKEPAKYWEMTDFPPLTNATYEAEDGSQRLYRDIALPHTVDPQRAQRIASIALGRARRGMVVNFPATVKMLGISAWDCIELDLSVGANSIFAGKKFRVVSWVLAENGQGIDLTLNEEDDAVYTWEAGRGAIVAQNDLSNLPSPWEVPAPVGIGLTEELYVTRDGAGVKARATLSWSDEGASSIRYTVARYRIEGSGDSGWTELSSVKTAYAEVLDISPGVYEWQARHYNTMGAVSDWSETLRKEVFGLGAEPSAMQGLTISAISSMALLRWTQSSDLDVRIGGKVEFRHSPALVGATLAESTSIGTAIPGSDTVAVLPLKAGTYLARFIDSSGIPSPVSMATTDGATVLAFSPVGSVEEEPLFNGDHSNTIAIDGALQLSGSASIDDLADFDATPSLDVAGGVASSGTYTFAAGIDFGSVQRVRLMSHVEASIQNVIDLIDDRTDDIDSWASLDGTGSANADAVVYVRTTMTDPAVSPVWSTWQRLDVAEFNCRAIDKPQLRMSTDDPAYNILVSQLSVTAETL